MKLFIRTHKQRIAAKGQLMLITVLIMGSAILGASVIGGLLVSNSIRQSGYATASATAIFAADAGLDQALFRCFKVVPEDCNDFFGFVPNGGKFTVTFIWSPVDPDILLEIDSLGQYGIISRALRITF